MKNITLSVEDEIVDEARIVAAEQKTTVNALVRDFLRQTVARRRISQLTGHNRASATREEAGQPARAKDAVRETVHQTMQRLLNEGRAKYADRKWFDRDETHDRDYQRAEGYFENRAALLKLIDETTGDMGKQKWNREALYDR